jgi:hypothetical protein
MIPKIFFPTAYLIQRLLRKYHGQLRSVIAAGAGLVAEPDVDLNVVLESLYVEPEEIAMKVGQIEALVSRYHRLNQKSCPDIGQQQEVELDIFWIFGLKLATTSSNHQEPDPKATKSNNSVAPPIAHLNEDSLHRYKQG